MRRFFVSPQEFKQDQVLLKDEEFHHLKNVCRLEEGERVEILDGRGGIATATIQKIDKKQAQLEITERRTLPALPQPQINLILSLPRFQKMDTIIQKSVELGVAQIIPVFSDRSFLKKPSADLKSKIHRWNKIALEACKQSGRAWPLVLTVAVDLEEQLEKTAPQSALFLYEGEGALNIKQALEKLTLPPEINVYIGAEGGFSPREVELFVQKGLKPITLGELVLRVETACITIAAVIKYHFNLMA